MHTLKAHAKQCTFKQIYTPMPYYLALSLRRHSRLIVCTDGKDLPYSKFYGKGLSLGKSHYLLGCGIIYLVVENELDENINLVDTA